MGKVVEPVLNVNEVSRVSSGTIIRGDIYSPNDIRIDGSFEGRIISKCKVVVGENAVITGDIVCENADFWGKMHGNFYVKDTLSLKSSAIIEADLKCRRLEIELDARFDGNCQTIDEQEFNRLTESMEMV